MIHYRTIIVGTLALLIAACGVQDDEPAELGRQSAAVSATKNTELIVYGQALDQYAAAVQAGGASGWSYRWQVGSARFVITPAGVRLKGQLIIKTLKAGVFTKAQSLQPALPSPSLNWVATGTQLLDLPVSVTYAGGEVRLQVSGAPVTVRDGQGQALFSVTLGPDYSTHLSITPDPFTAGTTTVALTPTQVLIEPASGYLRLTAQLTVN